MGRKRTPDGFSVAPTNDDPFPIGTQLVGAWSEIPLEFGGPSSKTWATCDGRLLHISQHPELYRRLGTRYNTGGEATHEFRIPDKRGRSSIGSGQGSGLTNRVQGTKLGVETHALSVSEMPSHTHDLWASDDNIGAGDYNPDPTPGSNAQPGNAYTATTGSRGGGTAHPNIQPSEVDLWIIKISL